MGAFIGNLTHINSVCKTFFLFEVSVTASVERPPPEKIGGHKCFKLLDTLNFTILFIIDNHVYILYIYVSYAFNNNSVQRNQS